MVGAAGRADGLADGRDGDAVRAGDVADPPAVPDEATPFVALTIDEVSARVGELMVPHEPVEVETVHVEPAGRLAHAARLEEYAAPMFDLVRGKPS